VGLRAQHAADVRRPLHRQWVAAAPELWSLFGSHAAGWTAGTAAQEIGRCALRCTSCARCRISRSGAAGVCSGIVQVTPAVLVNVASRPFDVVVSQEMQTGRRRYPSGHHGAKPGFTTSVRSVHDAAQGAERCSCEASVSSQDTQHCALLLVRDDTHQNEICIVHARACVRCWTLVIDLGGDLAVQSTVMTVSASCPVSDGDC
jgi:hypothetical protein